MKYYWCPNCGYHGNFRFFRQKNKKCEICSYENLTELDETEYTEWRKVGGHSQDKCPFYNSKGKLSPFGEELKNGKNKGENNV